MDKKKELQEEYKELYGKGAVISWNEATLEEKISEKKNPKEEEDGIVIDPNKTYVFKLKGEFAPVSFYPTEMETYDVVSKRSRKIRCVSIADSPYVDEQDADSTEDDKPIVFTEGGLQLQGTEANRIKYLLASDSIVGKEKTLPKNGHLANRFELEDREALSKAKLKKEDSIFEALQMIRKANLTDIKDFLRSYYLSDVDNSTKEDIIVDASGKAKDKPEIWLTDFNNPKHKIKADVQRLFNKGELSDSNGVIKWKKTDGAITNYDENSGVRADEVLTKFAMLDTKEAKDFKKTMEDKLS